MLGIGILLPWNAFVNAKPYFQSRFCDSTDDDTNTPTHESFEQWFGVIWNIASVLSLGSIIVFNAIHDKISSKINGHHQQASLRAHINDCDDSNTENNNNSIDNNNIEDPLDPNSRNELLCNGSNGGSTTSNNNEGHSFVLVMIPLSLYLTVFVCMVILVFIPNIPPNLFFNVTLVGLGICGMCQAIATSGIIATAGLFSPTIGISPFFNGQAVGGVVVAISNFITSTFEDSTIYINEQCNNNNYYSGSGGNPNINSNRWLVVDNHTYENDHDDYYFDEEWELQSGSVVSDVSLLASDGGSTAATSCMVYNKIDWVVFVYFSLGCIVLAICLVGYSFINKYQKFEHRNEYETVQNVSSMETDTSNDIQEDHGSGTPRIGLELNDRIRDRHEQEEEDGRGMDSDTIGLSSTIDTLAHHSDHDPLSSPLEQPQKEQLPQDEEEIDDNIINNNHVDCLLDDGSNLTAAVWSVVKGPACSVYMTFLVTLSLFPGW